jgi:hypothetical protein
MSSEYDATEFVDGDFLQHKSSSATGPGESNQSSRAPSRAEVDTKVAETHQKLAQLKRAQEELERERSALEETRRRQMEFQTGRQEMIECLTRGLVLLEEAEFNGRRELEQMSKALVDLRDAHSKLLAIKEESWGQENFSVELTRALTTVENARMEWNSARLKFHLLSAQPTETPGDSQAPAVAATPLGDRSPAEWCRIGLALTWPLALVGLIAIGLLAFALFRH